MSDKAQNTRHKILSEAFMLIYRKGYQNTSVDDILKHTHVTKGAFYYHFKNKDDMGLSMINNIMAPGMEKFLISPLKEGENPLQDLYNMMNNLLNDDTFFDVNFGCPAVNLIDEMAPLNEHFKKALNNIQQLWINQMTQLLEQAQQNQLIHQSANPTLISTFISTLYAGARNLGKLLGRSYYQQFLEEFEHYLSRLKNS